MNIYTEKSIELANQRNYLDLLFKVYPLSPDSIRDIDATTWKSVETNYKKGNNTELFKSLLKLPLFPVKDGYVPYFKHDLSAVERNPDTVDRICGRVRELELDKLWEKCTQPKETNRQMGPLFQNWLNKGVLGSYPVDEKMFLSKTKGVAILDGRDSALADFANRYLGYTRDKGLDFIARKGDVFIIGEAKFISDEGGHQNDQFLDAITTLNTKTKRNVLKVAVLDGILYIKSKKKMYQTITSNDVPVMSALLLRDYLYSL
ncbi:MAG: restriction endonuclease [Salinivirgaceae bacterium]|nr:restriction endonuclease [Salinivirgaceae bacterium]